MRANHPASPLGSPIHPMSQRPSETTASRVWTLDRRLPTSAAPGKSRSTTPRPTTQPSPRTGTGSEAHQSRRASNRTINRRTSRRAILCADMTRSRKPAGTGGIRTSAARTSASCWRRPSCCRHAAQLTRCDSNSSRCAGASVCVKYRSSDFLTTSQRMGFFDLHTNKTQDLPKPPRKSRVSTCRGGLSGLSRAARRSASAWKGWPTRGRGKSRSSGSSDAPGAGEQPLGTLDRRIQSVGDFPMAQVS